MAKKIAITGGIGSGKSTVIQILKEKGYDVFSCDAIYQNILTSKEYVQEIERAFPSAVFDGKIDKKKLANIVFNDPSAREKLDSIAHPLIMQTLLNKMNSAKSSIVFAEVPLLFEGDFEHLFDEIIVVMRKEEDRIAAIQQRDGLSNEQVRNRMNSQIDYNAPSTIKRIKNCNAYILDNNQEVEGLKNQISQFLLSQKQQS